MAIYLNGQKYSCNLGGQIKLIMVDLMTAEKPEDSYVTATAIDNNILTTADGLYLQVREE